MKKLIILLLLLLPSLSSAGELFYRSQATTSVTLGDICVPEFTGEEIFALDFDTTGLVITISAQGDGIDNTLFTYSGVNLDNYDGAPPAWGAPPASALELEAQADGCVKLHIRDEVFAVASATEWSIRFRDGATDGIMDWNVQVLDLANSADNVADVTTALNSYDAPTNAEMEARTIVSANYGTAANFTTLDGKLDTIDTNVSSTLDDTGTAGVILAAPYSAIVAGSGTADSGTNGTFVDAVLTEADTDYWKGKRVVFTSGNIDGQSACTTAFTPATDTVAFTPVTTQAVATNTYVFLHDPLCNNLVAILADTGELQTDDVPALIATAQASLDALTRGLAQLDTTIATLATQVSFTLTAGSADDDAYNGCGIMITDASTANQIAMAGIQDYDGGTLRVTLDADPAIFGMLATDLVTITCLGVNVQFMNGSEVLGVGSAGDKWRGN